MVSTRTFFIAGPLLLCLASSSACVTEEGDDAGANTGDGDGGKADSASTQELAAIAAQDADADAAFVIGEPSKTFEQVTFDQIYMVKASTHVDLVPISMVDWGFGVVAIANLPIWLAGEVLLDNWHAQDVHRWIFDRRGEVEPMPVRIRTGIYWLVFLKNTGKASLSRCRLDDDDQEVDCQALGSIKRGRRTRGENVFTRSFDRDFDLTLEPGARHVVKLKYELECAFESVDLDGNGACKTGLTIDVQFEQR